MTEFVKEILDSDKRHKEKVTLIVEKVLSDKNLVGQLFEILKNGSDVEKGTATEIMKFVSKEQPERILPYIDILIEYIDYKVPRVRWGCPESIGNFAKKYPDQVAKAIPKLFQNLNDKSTVVRWCAAYALTEIAKYNHHQQSFLMSKFNRLIKEEKNNGVRNLYVKSKKELK